MTWDISLSPSKLNKFNECPRCFWDAVNLKIEFRGIMASLPGGLDRVVKDHYDACRRKDIPLPPELVGKVPEGTKLYGSFEEIKKFRHWKSNPHKPLMKTKSGLTVSLIMAYDDLLIGRDGRISNLDAKSKGDAPKDDGAKHYQTQLDIYSLAGKLNGWVMSGTGYLAYYYPVELDGEQFLELGCDVFGLKADEERARDTIERAVICAKGSQPDHSNTCEICRFSQIRVEAALKTIAQPAIQQAIGAMA